MRHPTRKRTIVTLLTTGLLAAVPALGWAASIAITQSKFKYNGVSYFRAKAENVVLASYGEKKTPIGKPNYLAVQGNVKRVHLARIRVKISGPYGIDWDKYSKSDVDGNIKYIKTAGGTGSFSRHAAKKANLVLVKFSLNEGALKKLLNNHAKPARRYLSKEGNDARIVSEVWVVAEAKMAEAMTNCGSVAGQLSAKGIDVAIEGKGCGTSVSNVTIPANTTFGYMLHKVKTWGRNKSRVEDLEDDQQGLN